MEHIDCDSIAAFDTLYTTNHIQIMKILSSYFAPEQRHQFAVCIKYMELQYTLSCKTSLSSLSGCTNHTEDRLSSLQVEQIYTQIRPFCSQQEQQQIEQLLSLFQSMKMYQEIRTIMEVFRHTSDGSSPDASSSNGLPPDFSGEFFQNMTSGSEGEATSIMEVLMNLLSPEQRMIFEMFGGQNDNKTE